MSLLENNKRYKRTPKGVLTVLHCKQRERSKLKGLPEVGYSLQWLHERYLDDIKFKRLYVEWIKSGYKMEFKPSIDRLNCKKGYTKDNIQILTWGENRFKQSIEGKRGRSRGFKFSNPELLDN